MEPVQSNRQYICIVTHPRSGGTVLQRVLHSMPYTTFRGESEGAIVDICNLIFKIKDCQDNGIKFLMDNPSSDKSQHYGLDLINLDDLISHFNNIFINDILHINSNNKYIGWKECWFDPVFYGKKNIKKYFEILKLLFPQIKIIFNLRNPVITSNSPGMRGRDNPIYLIEQYHECYKYIHNINLFENNSIILNHEDWNGNPKYLFEQLRLLDLPVNLNSIEKILSEELVHLRHLN